MDGADLLQLSGGLHSADIAHPQVHDHDVGIVCRNRTADLGAVGALTDDLETIFAAQNPFEP